MYTMKTFLTAAFLLTAALSSNAQADLCDNCYVWEFTTDNGERDQTTRLLSNDVEDILSQYSGCKVLQRSRFARLQEHINNEKDVVQSLTGVKPEIKAELKTIQAKRVIFGTVNRDFQGNVSLRLSFENLQTTHVKSNTAFLINEDYYNFERRKEKLTAFINSFVNADGKMTAPVQVGEGGGTTPENTVIASENISEIEVSITKIEQKGTKIIFHLTFENKSLSDKVRSIWIGSDRHILLDQDANQYQSNYARIGSMSDQYFNLVSGNTVKGRVEFTVTSTKISKVQMLTIDFMNSYVFTNIKV